MDCSMPGLPVHHQLLGFTLSHVHSVGDAMHPPHSAIPFSSHLQSFPASGSFPMSWFFASGGQSVGASASASVLPMNFQWIFRTDFLQDEPDGSPCSPRDSQESSPTPQFTSINSLVALSLLYGPALTSVHDYFKNHSFDYTDFVGKGMSLLFNMLSRFFIAFLPRSKHLLISWLQ